MQATELNFAGIDNAKIEADLNEVRLLMSAHLNSSGPLIAGVIDHVLTHRGKMFRPLLVLLSGRCFGSITELHIRIAAIVEMIHTTTLLHDDVLDNAMQRRNNPTINALDGNKVAVLSGDYIFSRVFGLCAELERADISRILADTTTRLCQGELDQNLERGNVHLSESRYLEIITAKSASLLSTSCMLGAIASNSGGKSIQALERFGANLGIAFQITDDILDIVGDASRMGKPRAGDLDNGIVTLPVIHFLSVTPSQKRQELFNSLCDRTLDIDTRAGMLIEAGSIDYARSLAAHYYKNAVDSLAELPGGNVQNALAQCANFCIDRVI